MTEENLNSAYAGESMAYMKYSIWADKADAEGKPEVARLFRAIAHAERVHAGNHLRVLGGVLETAENLQHAEEGEHHEINEMYPAFKAVAELQNEKAAVRTTHWALETEKIHEGMFEKARQSVVSGKDAEFGDIWVCPVCGYTMEGTPPDACPICQAKKEKFRKF